MPTGSTENLQHWHFRRRRRFGFVAGVSPGRCGHARAAWCAAHTGASTALYAVQEQKGGAQERRRGGEEEERGNGGKDERRRSGCWWLVVRQNRGLGDRGFRWKEAPRRAMDCGCDGKVLRCGAGDRHQHCLPRPAWRLSLLMQQPTTAFESAAAVSVIYHDSNWASTPFALWLLSKKPR